MALAQTAIELNRHHPGWYHLVLFHHHYRKRDYEVARQTAKKINVPEFRWRHLTAAAACGMLGRHEEARTGIASLRKYNPTFLGLKNLREDIGIRTKMWWNSSCVLAGIAEGRPQRVWQRRLQRRANFRCQVQHAGLLVDASHPVDTYHSDLPVPAAPQAKK